MKPSEEKKSQEDLLLEKLKKKTKELDCGSLTIKIKVYAGTIRQINILHKDEELRA